VDENECGHINGCWSVFWARWIKSKLMLFISGQYSTTPRSCKLSLTSSYRNIVCISLLCVSQVFARRIHFDLIWGLHIANTSLWISFILQLTCFMLGSNILLYTGVFWGSKQMS
jgi:hypothetical protein